MRILLTPLPADAHYTLMVPLAWALQGAGHEVCVAVPPNFTETVARSGLTPVAVGPATDLSSPVATPEIPTAVTGLRSMETARDHRIRNYTLGALLAYSAPGGGLDPTVEAYTGYARRWRPDLVIWDPFVVPGAVAARAVGAAHARMLIGVDHVARMRASFREHAAADGGHADTVASLIDAQLRHVDQTFDEDMLLGQWTINPIPVLLSPEPGISCVSLGQRPFTPSVSSPSWVHDIPDRPRVCLTLGHSSSEALGNSGNRISLEDIFAGIADLDIEVITTLTSDQIPAGIDTPSNVHTADFVPLNTLLPTCAGIIHHGGANTLMAAAWYRVPQIIVPTPLWDEWERAQVAAKWQSAIVHTPETLTPATLRASVQRLLQDATLREGTERLRRAVRSAPSPNECVGIIERLTRWHQPRGVDSAGRGPVATERGAPNSLVPSDH